MDLDIPLLGKIFESSYLYKKIKVESIQKNDLIRRIQSIDNDELVAVLNVDISFFMGEKDVLDFIATEDLEELQQMVNEPFGFETETEEAFKKATERWRMN